MARRHWLLGTLLVLPIAAVGIAYALPPMDEYGSLDRIGNRFNPYEEEEFLNPPDPPLTNGVRYVKLTEESVREFVEYRREFGRRIVRDEKQDGVGRHRYWRIRVDEGAARSFLTAFLSKERGWGPCRTAWIDTHPTRFFAKEIVQVESPETGDHVTAWKSHPEYDATPIEIVVSVVEPKESLRPWRRLRRWASLSLGL